MLQEPTICSARSGATVEQPTRWPIGWSIVGALGVSGLMWWGVVEAGMALAARFAH
jgi:hypothetical protein